MRRSVDTEELTLYVMIGAIGAIPVVIALCGGRVFSTQETIGLLMLAGALAGIVALFHPRRASRHHP